MIRQEISTILLEMRSASIQASSTPTKVNYYQLIRKYGMPLLGQKFNTIHSYELCHYLKTNFNMKIDNITLNQILAEICPELDMKLKPLNELGYVGCPGALISAYSIELH